LVAKKCAILALNKQTKKPIDDASEEAVRSIGKYYTPKVDDFVIGTITLKNPEFYKVDIGTYTNAILNTKDFEGASKKTKPNLNLGDLVFARILKVNKFDAPVLSCVSQFDVKNWASGESFFGQLKGGNVFNFPMQHAWSFINTDNYLLNRLNDMLSFEIVVGHNGRLWISSDSNANTLDIYRLLVKSASLDKSEIEKMVHETFIDKIKK
jgi:exosome complex component RRP40